MLVRPGWRAIGDRILIVGEATPGLAGSAYAALAGVAAEDGLPALDLDRERRLQAFLREAATRGLLASAQDVSGGGLAVALAECCLWADRDRGLGALVRLPIASSPAVDLFGESPSRVVVSAVPRHAPAVLLLARQHGLPIEEIGEVGAVGTGSPTRTPTPGRGAWSSSSTVRAPPAPRRTAAAGSRTP